MLGTVPDVCKTNRNCNTSGNLYFDFYVSDAYVPAQNNTGNGATDVRFGSKADMCGATKDVRFVPIADIRPSLVKRGSRPNAQRRVAITTRRHLKSVAVGDSDQFPKRNLKASALGDGIAPRGNRRCPEPTGILDIRSLNG